MDEKDRKILDRLKEDGRVSYTEIADELNVSEGTVRNRVERMKESGAIKRFTVETGGEAAKAIILVKLEVGKRINEVLEGFPKDLNIMDVAGEYDLILDIERSSNEEVNDILDNIRSIDGVKSTETYMVLNQRS